MQLFKLKRWGLICIIFAILICATSLLIAKTYPEHIHIGFDIALPYIHLPICIIIPMVSLLVYYIKRLIRPREINP
jgi:spore germination protein KB